MLYAISSSINSAKILANYLAKTWDYSGGHFFLIEINILQKNSTKLDSDQTSRSNYQLTGNS